ncbi:MAG: aminopeptidase P family protein [Lentisphaerae bacterium]|nr:aminopeptidase P family protein [Lentisphaerota bacterium]
MRTSRRATGWILLAGDTAHCPDIRYATGFVTADPVVLLMGAREQFLVVPNMEARRAREAASRRARRATSVLTPGMLGIPRGRLRNRMAQWAAGVARRARARRVHVPGDFPLAAARELEKRGVRVVVGRSAPLPERAVKSPEEILRITEAQQAAVIAMRGAHALLAACRIDAGGCLRAGGARLTAEAVRQTITDILLAHNCFCKETIVSCGAASADPHARGEGPLRAHAPIVIDIFPQHMEHEYWGDLTRTVVRGRAAPRLRHMYQAVRAAQAAALGAIRPGARCEAVHRRAARELARRGFETVTEGDEARGFIHGTGHGVGLSIHERPSLSRGDDRLEAGNVVTVEPGLYYPEIGGVRIEDTVLVTRSGWRYLAPCEKKLEI